MSRAQLIKTKFVAFFIHLFLSIFFIGLFLLYIWQCWFPGPLFALEDVYEALKILIPVDAILGPMLTLLLYVPKKKSLVFDLTVVALFQVMALVYGGYTIYTVRPAAIVFAADRFEVVTYKQLNSKPLPLKRFKENERTIPLLAYAKRPKKELLTVDGAPYSTIPDNYYPLQDFKDNLVKMAVNVDDINPKADKDKAILKAYLESHKNHLDNLLFYFLQGTSYHSILMVLDKKSLNVVDYIHIDPWDH